MGGGRKKKTRKFLGNIRRINKKWGKGKPWKKEDNN